VADDAARAPQQASFLPVTQKEARSAASLRGRPLRPGVRNTRSIIRVDIIQNEAEAGVEDTASGHTALRPGTYPPPFRKMADPTDDNLRMRSITFSRTEVCRGICRGPTVICLLIPLFLSVRMALTEACVCYRY